MCVVKIWLNVCCYCTHHFFKNKYEHLSTVLIFFKEKKKSKNMSHFQKQSLQVNNKVRMANDQMSQWLFGRSRNLWRPVFVLCSSKTVVKSFFPYMAASFYLTTITNNFFRPAQETGIDQNKPPQSQTPATAGYGLHGNPSIDPIWIQFQK